MYRVSLKTGGTRPITFIDRTSSQLRSGGMRLIEDKNISNLITEYWQLIAQLNEFENDLLKFYIDLFKGILKAELHTFNFYLIRFIHAIKILTQ